MMKKNQPTLILAGRTGQGKSTLQRDLILSPITFDSGKRWSEIAAKLNLWMNEGSQWIVGTASEPAVRWNDSDVRLLLVREGLSGRVKDGARLSELDLFRLYVLTNRRLGRGETLQQRLRGFSGQMAPRLTPALKAGFAAKKNGKGQRLAGNEADAGDVRRIDPHAERGPRAVRTGVRQIKKVSKAV